MSGLSVTIKNLKNIISCEFDISLDKGLYAIVSENGCGKSAIMQAMSLLVRPSSYKDFKSTDYDNDSIIELSVDGVVDRWYVRDSKMVYQGNFR